jgi:large subunit ribosomal protein L49
LVASQTAHVSYPPPEFVSDPRPKISKGSRRSSKPFVDRSYLKTAAEAPGYGTRPPLNPAPVEFLPEAQSAPNLPYFVTRTRSHELPVYEDEKRGGNLELTYVKKVDGNLPLLRDALRERLNLDSKHAIVNDRTRHVVLKGHYKQEVLQFLRERRF